MRHRLTWMVVVGLAATLIAASVVFAAIQAG
jgi:hypothetical protein